MHHVIDLLEGFRISRLVPSGSMLKAFNAHTFKPHGIILVFPIELSGKTMEIEVEVVDAPMDYNLLLGHNWTYAMNAITSTLFRVIRFPHNGKIVTVDQLAFHHPKSTSATSAIPMVQWGTPKLAILRI